MSLLMAFMLSFPENDARTAAIPDEIVIVAKPRKCDLSSAGLPGGGRPMRESDFKRYAAEWAAGRPVRVVVPHAARTRCLAKIMLKLHDHGVTLAKFVDAPPGAANGTAPDAASFSH